MKYQTVVGIPTNLQISIYGAVAASKMALLAAVERGDKVTALFPAGKGIKDGKVVQEFKNRTGIVNPLLIFKDANGTTNHIVINLGGKYGTPGVVDASNIVKVTRSA